MMRATFLISIILSFLSSNAMDDVRSLYLQAVTKQKANTELLDILDTKDQNNPLVQGYKAVAIMMRAQYTPNPYYKYKYYREGKSQLESVIAKNGNNSELHYLRVCVQVNLPEFLDYRDNIEEDVQVLKNALRTDIPENLRIMYQVVIDEYVKTKSSNP